MIDYSRLRSRLTGTLATAGDADYTAGAAASNPAIQHRPAAVVRAASEDDVVETVRFARAEGLPVRIHATGSGARYAYESGILLVVSALDAVTVDPDARTATVGGGARWAAVVAAAAEHGLAPIAPSVPSLGVAGFLVGGGLGLLARSHGFGSDRVVAARVVTGEGEVVEASPNGDVDLFWAIRGGKTGLGVITEIMVSLIELPSLYTGTLFFDLAESTDPFVRWIDWTGRATESLTTSGRIFRFPDIERVPPPLRGKHLFALHVAYPGPADEGERLTASLREFGSIYLDRLGPLSISDLARVGDEISAPAPSYRRGAVLAKADRAFADTLLAVAGPNSELPIAGAEVRHLGGAARRDPGGGTAVGYRDFDYALIVFGLPDRALFDDVLPRTFDRINRELALWISPHTTPNWINDPRSRSEAARAWPAETLVRLDAVRTARDPTGVFREWPDRHSREDRPVSGAQLGRREVAQALKHRELTVE
jgi:FAD/FMN-containing dehydrogenase